MIHKSSICESQNIGVCTNIQAFVHIIPSAIIRTECNICDFVFIKIDVKVSDPITIKSGVQIRDGVTIARDIFIGPNVMFMNDKNQKVRIKF